MKLTTFFRVKSGINVWIPANRMWSFSAVLYCRTRSCRVVVRGVMIGPCNPERRKTSTPLGRTELCPSICKLIVANRASNIKSKVKICICGIRIVHKLLEIHYNTNKCIILYYKVFIIYNKLRHVSTFCGAPSGNVH